MTTTHATIMKQQNLIKNKLHNVIYILFQNNIYSYTAPRVFFGNKCVFLILIV